MEPLFEFDGGFGMRGSHFDDFLFAFGKRESSHADITNIIIIKYTVMGHIDFDS